MYRRMRDLAVMLLCVSVLVPVAAAAQRSAGAPTGVGTCGPLDEAGRLSLLEHYAPLFTSTDEDQVDFRASMGLEQVFPSDPLSVVGRPGDCGRVVTEAFRILNDRVLSGHPPATRAHMEWAVLRIGPYLVVPMNPRPVEGVTVQGFGQVLVFTASDLKFVDWFLG